MFTIVALRHPDDRRAGAHPAEGSRSNSRGAVCTLCRVLVADGCAISSCTGRMPETRASGFVTTSELDACHTGGIQHEYRPRTVTMERGTNNGEERHHTLCTARGPQTPQAPIPRLCRGCPAQQHKGEGHILFQHPLLLLHRTLQHQQCIPLPHPLGLDRRVAIDFGFETLLEMRTKGSGP